MDFVRHVLLIQVDLLQKRRKRFTGVEVLEVLPEEFATVDSAAAAQVKEVHGQQRSFLMEAEDVHVFPTGSSHLLALPQLFNRGDEVATTRRLFELQPF